MTEQYSDVGPPPLGEITHPVLQQSLDFLHKLMVAFDFRLALEPAEDQVFVGTVDAGNYVAHPLDNFTRELFADAYEFTLKGVGSIPSAELSGWEQDIVERTLRDVGWRRQLLSGLSKMQPINSTPFSIQNRVLLAARGDRPFVKLEDYTHFLGELRAIQRAFGQVRNCLEEGIATRDTITKMAAQAVYDQLERVLRPSGADQAAEQFYPPGLSDYPALAERYREVVRVNVLPSYQELQDFIGSTYLPQCHDSPLDNPFHGQRYELLARYHTDNESTTPERIGQIALECFDEAEAAIRTVWREEFPEVPQSIGVTAFIEILRKGPRRKPPTKQEIEAEYELRQAKNTKTLLPRFPAWVARTLGTYPLRIRVDTSSLAENTFPFYQLPSVYYGNASWPGVFVEPVSDLAGYNWSRIPARLKHEGEPAGHHLHFLTLRLQQSLPRYHRVAIHPLAFEGYAKYAEGLGAQDRWERAAAASTRLHEARVLKLDYEGNVEGKTDADLRKRLEDMYGVHPEKVREIKRGRETPTNYVVYLLGKKLVEATRQYAEQGLGADFSEVEFHDIMLREGPLLPAILKQRVQRWIDSKG